MNLQKPPFWTKGKEHLTEVDPVLGSIIETYQGDEGFNNRGDAFHTLLRSVVGQQISVKAAASVWAKFERAVGEVTPERILRTEGETLRGAGLSRQKVRYVQSIAEFHTQGHFEDHHWEKDEPELVKHLTQITGIGQWTAEMFMMFHLQKPNVLPLGDLGLQKGIEKNYNNSEKLSVAEMKAIAAPWAPYSSIATWYLWRSLENE